MIKGTLAKMTSMGVKVDWSDSRPDTASAALLDEYYKDLVIRSDDNYGNSERMGERRQQKSFEAMGNPWTTAPRVCPHRQ